MDPASSDTTNHPPWSLLPANVLVRIFHKLSLQDLCCCTLVCHQFQIAAHADSIWKALLQQHYSCDSPNAHKTSCKRRLQQLKTASLWSCGSHWSNLQPAYGGSNSTTTLLKLWSNLPSPKPLPLNTYCTSLPSNYAIAAVAAGKNDLVLLSCTGEVIDTRAAATAATPLSTLEAAAAAGINAHTAASINANAAAGVNAEAAAGVIADLANDNLVAAADVNVVAAAEQQLEQQGLGEWAQQQQQQQQQEEVQQAGVLSLLNPWRPPGAQITTIAAGTGHVLAVTSAGGVWGWGSNESGQLGLGHNNNWQSYPVEITAVLEGAWKAEGDTIVSAACGDAHSALLASKGAVYTAGCNKQGQCAQEHELQLCPVFCQPAPGGVSAVAVACGVANTAIASAQGRLLVCGDSICGQCGAGNIKAGCCHEFVDIGPELSWHGLNRPTADQVAAVGGNLLNALPKVVQVAVGSGTGYAVTNEGEVYAWGAGSKGQLGRGGCTKVQATPAKLPWAKDVTQIRCSLDGAFAAAVDDTGHLYTWGAGKWGQLGHGDTSKRTVGRAVKQLKHLSVLQAVCGSESLLVLTCNRPHTGHSSAKAYQANGIRADSVCPAAAAGLRAGSSASLDRSSSMMSNASSRGSRPGRSGSGPAAAAAVLEDAGLRADGSGDLARMDGVDWVDVEGEGPFYCPHPRSGYARKGSRAARRHAAALEAAGGSNTPHELQTSIASHLLDPMSPISPQLCDSTDISLLSSSAPAATAACAAGSSSTGFIYRTSTNTSSSSSGSRYSRNKFNKSVYRHSARESVSPAAGPWCLDHPISNSAAAAAGGGGGGDKTAEDCEPTGSEGPTDSGWPGKRRQRMDKGFKLLLKRLLKQFVSDSKQRELTFPASLSSADRYYIHVAADSWGLGHASHNDENGDRVIKVWKVSRARRMMSGADSGFGSD